jgi:hypothetical protein
MVRRDFNIAASFGPVQGAGVLAPVYVSSKTKAKTTTKTV